MIGKTRSELDGSEYHRSIYGLVQGNPPEVFIEDEYNAGKSVLDLIKEDVNGNITCSS